MVAYPDRITHRFWSTWMGANGQESIQHRLLVNDMFWWTDYGTQRMPGEHTQQQ